MVKHDMENKQLGYTHVVTGDGKGKTTSALGMALRAAGHGFKVLIIQWLKKGWNYGELRALTAIPQITLVQYGRPEFIDRKNPKEIDITEAQAALIRARTAVEKEDWDVLILDEINVALDFGLISKTEVIKLIKQKPKKLEIILTGRNAPRSIVALADYHTEIQSHKHPYQREVLARRGVEY
ncbi:MAG: cob(I)yrinic acid a,c-diamide adenosyltransferase [Candidatus Heimdallarchaeota archaeon]